VTLGKRLGLAAAIVVLDLVTVAVPIAAFALAYVIIARPRSFLEWVLRVYDDQGSGPGPAS
jgi:hypothetical protein